MVLRVGEEFFHNKSLVVKERNYLDIYTYDFWTESSLPVYHEGDRITTYEYVVEESNTKV